MIIKYSFGDNDFTQVLEKYLDEFGPFYGFNYDNDTDRRKFMESIKAIDDYHFSLSVENSLDDVITEQEYETLKSKLIELLKENFKTYINNIKPNSNWCTEGMDSEHLQECKDYMFNNLNVDIVRFATDDWDNGETVYYFTSNQKYVTL